MPTCGPTPTGNCNSLSLHGPCSAPLAHGAIGTGISLARRAWPIPQSYARGAVHTWHMREFCARDLDVDQDGSGPDGSTTRSSCSWRSCASHSTHLTQRVLLFFELLADPAMSRPFVFRLIVFSAQGAGGRARALALRSSEAVSGSTRLASDLGLER
jgi:hypothetical protein